MRRSRRSPAPLIAAIGAAGGEALDEGDGLLVHAQVIGVGDAARQHQAVELVGRDVGQGLVDRQHVAFLVVVHALDLARLERDDGDLSAGVAQRLLRLDEFDLLDAVGSDESNLAAFKCACDRLCPPLLKQTNG